MKTRIGFVVGNYHTDHPRRLVEGLWNLLRDEDIELQVFLGTESASFMKDFAMRSNQFDYQYAALCGYTQYEHLDLLIISAGTLSIYQNAISLNEFLRHTSDVPMILMETDEKHEGAINLIADNVQGLSDCVEHLITVHGLTRIGFIAGPKNNRDAEERITGYRQTLQRHGIKIREDYIATGDYSENVDRIVEKLLDRAPDLQAIVSSNDEMAIAIYRVCKWRGLTVGRDIAVTGFDDMKMAQYMEPPLTTSKQDYDAFVRKAVECAKKMLRGEEASSQRIKSPFIRRCSCGCTPEMIAQDQPVFEEHKELIRNMERTKEYQHNSWIGSLMNREMLLVVDDPRRFFETVGSFMAYLGTSASYLCLFEHAIRVRQGVLPEFPEKILVCMRQQGRRYEGYDWDEAPVMYRHPTEENPGFQLEGSFMTFLLFDGRYQYGVLNVSIEPEKIDFYYMLSLDIGTNLRYMDMWTQQKMYRAELQEMARTDTLTNLNNRAGVVHVRERMVGRVSRPAGVIMADLDHLKQINDYFGHSEGDEALKVVADILRKVFPERPEIGATTTIGRIGGDEFIFCGIDVSEAELEEYVRQIKEECVKYNASSQKPYYVEISAGIAVGKVRNMEDWADLSRIADERLYKAKRLRRSCVVREKHEDSPRLS